MNKNIEDEVLKCIRTITKDSHQNIFKMHDPRLCDLISKEYNYGTNKVQIHGKLNEILGKLMRNEFIEHTQGHDSETQDNIMVLLRE